MYSNWPSVFAYRRIKAQFAVHMDLLQMQPNLCSDICLKEVAKYVDESNTGCAWTVCESLCRSQNHFTIYTHRVKYSAISKYANFAAQYFNYIPAMPSTAMFAGTVQWHDLTTRDAGQHLGCNCITHAIMTRLHSHWCLLCTAVLVHDQSLQTIAQCSPHCNMLLHTHTLCAVSSAWCVRGNRWQSWLCKAHCIHRFHINWAYPFTSGGTLVPSWLWAGARVCQYPLAPV